MVLSLLNDKTSHFKQEAIRQQNQTAQNFISDYNAKLGNLYNDPVAGLLIRKRNIEIHRTDIAIQAKFYRTISETISVTDSVSIEVRDKYGNIKVRSEPTQPQSTIIPENTQPKNNPVSSSSVEWFFTDFKKDDVITICNTFLALVKSLVSDIRNAYP